MAAQLFRSHVAHGSNQCSNVPVAARAGILLSEIPGYGEYSEILRLRQVLRQVDLTPR
jgi:hypothetical protein